MLNIYIEYLHRKLQDYSMILQRIYVTEERK